MPGKSKSLTGLELAEIFFSALLGPSYGFSKREAVVISHTLGSSLPFFRALDNLLEVKRFFHKRSSVDVLMQPWARGLKNWGESLPADHIGLTQSLLSGISESQVASQEVYLLDVGGKFAEYEAGILLDELERTRVTIIEDTENGHQAYERLVENIDPRLLENLRIVSVARSMLKEPEDYWTGRGIVEATETILRTRYELLSREPCYVIGYGKIGRSIAHSLREKRLIVHVVEKRVDRRTIAQSHGFPVCRKEDIYKTGGFIFSATGAAGSDDPITLSFFEKFERPVTIVCATSIDKEIAFDTTALSVDEAFQEYESRQALTGIQAQLGNDRVADLISHLLSDLRSNPLVRLLNNGNPPNFIFEASCGPYIFLVQGAIVQAIFDCLLDVIPYGMRQVHNLSDASELKVFECWNEVFATDHGD